MRKMLLFSFIIGLLRSTGLYAQAPSSIYFRLNNAGSGMKAVCLDFGQFILEVDGEGKEVSCAVKSGGDIEYFSAAAETDKVGKIKSIGSVTLDYWTGFFDQQLAGKLKLANNLEINYYSSRMMSERIPKLKSIGSVQFDYYSNFHGAALAGKMKSIAGHEIEYWSDASGSELRGKIKSIGGISFGYFSAMHGQGVSGKLKFVRGNQDSFFASIE